MIEELSLRMRLSLVAGSVLIGALLSGLLGSLLWMTSEVQGEQSASVQLQASEFERLVASHHARSGQLPAPGVLQQAIHRRWIREPGLLRISLFQSDGTIVADTDVEQVGQRVPAQWQAVDSLLRPDKVTDQAGQSTYVATIAVPDLGPVYRAGFQIRPSRRNPELQRAIYSALGLAVPMLLLSLAVLFGLCALASRLILADSPVDAGTGGQPATGMALRAAATDPLDHLPGMMRDTVESLERAARDLQQLASR